MNQKAARPPAQRMRASRERRRAGFRCVTVEACEAEIELLIAKGWLPDHTKSDRDAIGNAYGEMLATLSPKAWSVNPGRT